MAFKTTDTIIQTIIGLLTSITVPKYPFSRPADSTSAEYIVVNCLPVTSDVLQKCYFNVNYHVRDIEAGKPDIAKMSTVSSAVMAILQKVSTTTYLIDFETQEIIRQESMNEHYTNLRFSFKTI